MKKRPTDRLIHEIDLEVRYKETDQMGVVHHSNYLVWFELARTALCEQSGKRYADIEKLGYWLMVTGVRLDYRAPTRYGDCVRVGSWIHKIGSRSLHFGYDVRRIGETEPTGPVVVRGVTEHAWVSVESGRVCRVASDLQDGFKSLLAI